MGKLNSQLYCIHCLTNMHMGSGEDNLSIIDKQVQRDEISGYPVLHSSGIKGALREYAQSEELPDILRIFGSSPKEPTHHRQGDHIFSSGQLLSLPMRSNIRPFYRCISAEILRNFKRYMEYYDGALHEALVQCIDAFILHLDQHSKEQKIYVMDVLDSGTAYIEDYQLISYPLEPDMVNGLSLLEALCGRNIALCPDPIMNEFCSNLPVMARNYLENGESKNLWYEEIVPRESRFYAFISPLDNTTKAYIHLDNQNIQMGGWSKQ